MVGVDGGVQQVSRPVRGGGGGGLGDLLGGIFMRAIK